VLTHTQDKGSSVRATKSSASKSYLLRRSCIHIYSKRFIKQPNPGVRHSAGYWIPPTADGGGRDGRNKDARVNAVQKMHAPAPECMQARLKCVDKAS